MATHKYHAVQHLAKTTVVVVATEEAKSRKRGDMVSGGYGIWCQVPFPSLYQILTNIHYTQSTCKVRGNLYYTDAMSTWIHDKRKASGLSQTAVAEALGISRPTYIKLEQGGKIPTSEQKEILSRVLCVSAKDTEKLSQPISGSVSDSPVPRMIPKENVEKFRQTLLYILGKVGSRPNIGQTALYKLLYFVDFDYYEKYEQQLIGATYIKNTYGPTPVSFAKIVREMQQRGDIVEVKSKYFGHDQTKYIAAKEADVSCFEGRELKHIDDEIERLAHLTAKELSDISHLDTPWRVAEQKEILDYEYVFYRPEETSVREYEPL